MRERRAIFAVLICLMAWSGQASADTAIITNGGVTINVKDGVVLPSQLWDGKARFVIDREVFPGHGQFMSAQWADSQLWSFDIAHKKIDKELIILIGISKSNDLVNFTTRTDALDLRQPKGAWNDGMASFPGVWKYGSAWHLVYEGKSLTQEGRFPGDIGYSSFLEILDTWVNIPEPILIHNHFGFEKLNIGTPSLWKEGNFWYLFYHGFGNGNGGGKNDCQVGLAVGTDFSDLKRVSSDPIISTGIAGTWDSGTIGRRSIVKESNVYYMLYEGSTDQVIYEGKSDFSHSKWSTGLARSIDLVFWEKWPGNPILPVSEGMGYDGPEWVVSKDKIYAYFRSGKWERKEAEYSNFASKCGSKDSLGWFCNKSICKNPCHMTYGVQLRNPGRSSRRADFNLLIDDNTADDSVVATIDVYDAKNRIILAVRPIRRKEFLKPLVYQSFQLEYSANESQELEYRVYYHPLAYIKQKNVVDYKINPKSGRAALEQWGGKIYEAEKDFAYRCGKEEKIAKVSGRSCPVNMCKECFMAFGPYAKDIAPGERMADFRLMIDNNTELDLDIVTIDVYDATTKTILNSKIISRRDFKEPWKYQRFGVPFHSISENALEFRVFYHSNAFIGFDKVEVY